MSDKFQFVRSPEPKTNRTSANKPAMLSAWRWWLPPAALALVFILIFVDPFIGDWDALEYTLNALHGTPSSMALGRGLFIFFNHALYVFAHAVFHLQPRHAYLLFKHVVVAQGPLAVIACWILTRDLSGSKYAATIAALLLTFSPVFVIYSGQVMTDVPALLLTTVALIVHLRGLQQRKVWLVILGAALLGAGVNLRETVGFYGPWLIFAPFVCGWRPNRRGLFLSDSAARRRGIVCQPAAASELQHDDWLALPFDWFAGALAALFALSLSVNEAASGNRAARVYRHDVGNRFDWRFFRRVLMADTQRVCES